MFEVLRKFQVKDRDQIENLVNPIQRIECVRDFRDVFIELMRERAKIVGLVVARPSIPKLLEVLSGNIVAACCGNIDFDQVDSVIKDCGAVVHSIDSVSSGKKLVEEVETPQDR